MDQSKMYMTKINKNWTLGSLQVTNVNHIDECDEYNITTSKASCKLLRAFHWCSWTSPISGHKVQHTFHVKVLYTKVNSSPDSLPKGMTPTKSTNLISD
jgi:hypothetical protein